MNHQTPKSLSKTQKRDSAWAQLTAEYLQDLLLQLSDIQKAWQQADYPQIKQHAHRNKGTAGTYQLKSLSELFALLEEAAEDQRHADITGILDQLEQCLNHELRTHVPPAPTTPPMKGNGHE